VQLSIDLVSPGPIAVKQNILYLGTVRLESLSSTLPPFPTARMTHASRLQS